MTTLNKIILKTAVAGLIWTAVVFSYGLGIFAICFPSVMTDFYVATGDKRLSALYSERSYKRNPNINNLYFALDKFILAKNNAKIIEYSEKLFENKETYYSIVDQVSEFKRDRAAGDPITLGYLCNEDDRLRSSYIGALIKRGKVVDIIRAEEIFYEAITVGETFTNEQFLRPSYAIFEFGRDASAELRIAFEDYYWKFEAEYKGTPNDYAPKFYVWNVYGFSFNFWDSYLAYFGGRLT